MSSFRVLVEYVWSVGKDREPRGGPSSGCSLCVWMWGNVTL